MDGFVIFMSLDDLKNVKSPPYQNIINKFKPKIEEFITKKQDFDKLCSFVFRKKELTVDYQVLFLCLKDDETIEIVKKFRIDFPKYYSNFISNNYDFFRLQKYELYQPLKAQFYDPSMKFIGYKGPEKYFTSFNNQGMVLSTEQSKDASKVKYSFRYDQIINCRGEDPSEIRGSIDNNISNLYRSNECCVGYIIDWNEKPLKNFFCSLESESLKCKTDIKIFQATMYANCVASAIDKLKQTLKEYKGSLENILSMSFSNKSILINILKEIIKIDIKVLNKNTQLYKDIVELKVNAMMNLYALLKSFDKEKVKVEVKVDPKVEGKTDGKGKVKGDALDAKTFSSGSAKKDGLSVIESLTHKFTKDYQDMKTEFREFIRKDASKVEQKAEVKSQASEKKATVEQVQKTSEAIINNISRSLGGVNLSDSQITMITTLVQTNYQLFIQIVEYNVSINLETLESFSKMSVQEMNQRFKKIMKENDFLVKIRNETLSEGCPIIASNKSLNSNVINKTDKYDEKMIIQDNKNASLPIDVSSQYKAFDDLELAGCDKPQVIKSEVILPNKTIFFPPHRPRLSINKSNLTDNATHPEEKDTAEPYIIPFTGYPSSNNTGIITFEDETTKRLRSMELLDNLLKSRNLRKK
jgi:hypothetical protein